MTGRIFIVLFVVLLSLSGKAQGKFTPSFKLGINFQTWVRFAELNPGSTYGGNLENQITDISIRRARFISNIAISPSLTFFAQIGTNNIRANNGGPYVIQLLDFQVMYAPKDAFKLVIGKTGFKGISRYANPSTSTILGLDLIPIQIAQVNQTDDLLRRLSLTALGKLNRFNYRLVLADPNQSFSNVPLPDIAQYAPDKNHWNIGGYFSMEFRDKESHKNPYMRGTYLGAMDVFNVGAGFEFQNEAMWYTSGNDTLYSALFIAAADIYYEHPINRDKNNVITLYAAVYHYQQGPQFMRQLSLNNPVNTGVGVPGLINGPGTAYPSVGTGNHTLWQAAYLLGKSDQYSGQFQVNGAVQIGALEALNHEITTTTWLGLQYFLNGHRSKISLSWINRPLVYTNGLPQERRSEIILQYQLKLNE